MGFINITLDNLYEEHISCAIADKTQDILKRCLGMSNSHK